jgi:hypothetical protein
MRNINSTILSGLNNATQTGQQIDSNQLINISFHLHVSDVTAAGTFKIQASNDVCPIGPTPFTVTNWADIPSASVTQAAGTQDALITLSNVSYRWIRAVWTKTTSGSGTVTVNMNAAGA